MANSYADFIPVLSQKAGANARREDQAFRAERIGKRLKVPQDGLED